MIQFFGRLHPLLVHLPIGILLLALLLLWLSRNERYSLSSATMKIIWLSGTFGALLSCISGFLLSLDGDYDGFVVGLHMWMGLGLTAVSLFICARVFANNFGTLFKIAVILLLLLIFLTGHLGGTLTHGEDYLQFNDAKNNQTVPLKPIANIQQAVVYADLVQPLLQSRCYDCHASRKQKGGLRLDDSSYILKGGKDGKVLVSGNGGKSEFIRRLLLPREDEDHMPPKGKPQLSEKQIALLHWWVNSGASFSKKVSELPQPEKMRAVLLTFQNAGQERAKNQYIPEGEAELPDPKAVRALRERGVVILPVSQNSNYLSANFVTAQPIRDSDMINLAVLHKQLIWLKVYDKAVNDKQLSLIGACKNLRILQLNNASFSGKGLVKLQSLDSLRSLSLVGTDVRFSDVKSMHLKGLQELFLFGTKLTDGEIEALRKEYPGTKIIAGNYTLKPLVTDTSLVQPPKK